MAEKRIGLLLLGDNEWVGGLYYVLNIIRSLDYLPEIEKPIVYVFYGNPIAKNHLDNIKYTKLIKINYNKSFFIKVLNKIFQQIFKIDLKTKYFIKKYNLLGIYPYNYDCKVNVKDEKVIAWFPDFQHKYLPHLFSEIEINNRDKYLDSIQNKIKHLVFSSYTAQDHYHEFYANSKIKTYVLQFNSILKYKLPEISIIKDKYQIKDKYFIVSNQFWKHKNHMVVLQAISNLATVIDLDFKIIFTGKEIDHRDPDYFNTLMQYIEKQKINKYFMFLGFIPREDQLALMNNSMAVIQPSLFEGWGTVVEDAKTLQKQVIASNTKIHQEQLGQNAYYFSENDFEELAQLMINYSVGKIRQKHNYVDIEKRALTFSRKLLDIFYE